MAITTSATITIHKVIRATNPVTPTEITPTNTNVSIRNSAGDTVLNTTLTVTQPTVDDSDPDDIILTDGSVIATIPLEYGSNSISLIRASSDNLNDPEYVTYKEGTVSVSRVDSAAEIKF